jgi:hypothetical protein
MRSVQLYPYLFQAARPFTIGPGLTTTPQPSGSAPLYTALHTPTRLVPSPPRAGDDIPMTTYQPERSKPPSGR